MRHCVVNVAVGGSYVRWQDSLRSSLRATGYQGDSVFWTDGYPTKDCPPHSDVPYAFKVHAIEAAISKGYDTIIWADTSIWFRKPLAPIREEIEREGYWLSCQGWSVGQWCSDEALPLLGITREEAWDIPMVAATFFGVSILHPAGKELFDRYAAHCRDGSFKGAWRLEGVDDDVIANSPPHTVLGHRHDQTALSVVAHKMGIKVYWPPCRFAYHKEPQDDIVIAVAGGKD